jgi:hypothetical protein
MPANRSNIGYHLDNMIGDRVAKVAVTRLYKAVDGVTDAMGLTVPANNTKDPAFAPGCIFRHIDGEVVATGTVDSGDATSLIDATLTTTFDSNDELIGNYVVDTDKQMYGLIEDYVQSTGDITVDDWVDFNGTAVAAAKVPVSGDAFIVFKQTSGNVLYVNTGNDIVGCRFERVLTAGMSESTLIDTQDSPSQAIWAGVDLNALRNLGGGFLYENDFMDRIPNANVGSSTTITTADWTLTAVTEGGVHRLSIAGGGMLVDSAGNATADDGVEAQLVNCAVVPAAGAKIYFEARVKMKDTGDDQYYIGLAAVDTTLIAAGVVDDVVDKAAFFRDSGGSPADDKLSTIISRGDAENEGADKASVADDTWTKLGIVIDGLTSVKFYQDGKLVHTNTTTASIPNALMCLSFVAKVEQTSADAELSIDWVRLAQVGVRNA